MTAPNARLGRYSRLRIADGVEYFSPFKYFAALYIDPAKISLETAMDGQTINPLLTTKIVGSYVRHNTVAASQLPDLITTVHRSLVDLGGSAAVEEILTPAVSVRQSVRHDYVVCLD